MPQLLHNLRLDTRPLYIQAVDALYDLLETGGYSAGQPLPAEAELATRLGVSRSTIREALSHLEKDGLIIRRQGVGTFVAPQSEQIISGGLERLASFRSVAELAGASVQIVARTVTSGQADRPTAEALLIPLGSAVIRVQVAEALDGCQLAYLEGFIAPEHVDFSGLTADDGSLLEHLYQQSELSLSYSRSAIYAIEADRTLAEHLSVPEGKAILYLAEIVYTDTDAPIAFFRNYFVTDCYNFKIVRRIVRSSGPIRRAVQGRSQNGTV